MAGVTYYFRLRAQNVHGWSEWSSPYIQILAASVPAKMAMVNVVDGLLSKTAVKVNYLAPNSRGSEIVGYDFMFKAKDGTFYSGAQYLGIKV